MIPYKSFGELLNELREERHVTLERLGAGLCDVGKLSRIEAGKVEAKKALRDRLLDRLGVVEENYEAFLYYSEYKGWKEQQEIVHDILHDRLADAKEKLDIYQHNYSMEQPLEYQFYLSMLVQIRRREGASEQELGELFQQALYLTVSKEMAREPERILLSVEELNLLVEYVFFCGKEERLSWYDKLFSYVESRGLDRLAMAKMYPKLVYYYCQCWEIYGVKSRAEYSRLLKLCNKAIEILQKGNRMFFLWELLIIKEQLLQTLIDENAEKGEQAVKTLKEWKQTCVNWHTTLAEVYEEYGVSKETQDFCYIYVDREAHCIEDVIRMRRKMFGMSMKQLSEGICSERTVSRLERKAKEPHREIVGLLFERLKMPAEFCRKDLVTGKPEALRLLSEAKEKCNKKEFDASHSLLEQIKSMVSYEIPGNMQVIRRLELANEWHRKRINKEELDRRYFVEQLKEILGDTIPYEIAVAPGEKYLTQNEVACLQNIMIRANCTFEEEEQCVTALYELFEKQRRLEECFDIYELVMGTIASNLGNRGEYDLSNEIGLKILRGGLIYRRLGWIYKEKYDLVWNNIQRKKSQHSTKQSVEVKKEILKCINLCEMSGDLYELPFFEKVLEMGIK